MPSKESFEYFTTEIEALGFIRIGTEETRKKLHEQNLHQPRKRKGREIGFKFYRNGLCVYVWTTYLHEKEEAREEDSGWVCITEGDTAKYFSEPLKRTKNFFKNMLIKARIAQYRIIHRPRCLYCKDTFLDIVRGRGVRSRYWKCGNTNRHEEDVKVYTLPWDTGMPPKARAFLDKKRKKKKSYNKKRIAEGKETYTAMKNRKPWKAKK